MMDIPWIEWSGGESPVPDDVVVDIKTRAAGTILSVSAGLFFWDHVEEMDPYEIEAYRIPRKFGGR